MSARNELEQLKSEFMNLNNEAEISSFKKKINENWRKKTDAEKEEFCEAFVGSVNEAVSRADKVYNYVNVKLKLSKILDIVSISYIAETYFKKSRSWFSQRLNGHLVNGIPVSFTDGEIKILSDALDDISNIIKNTARSIA
jgi:methionyl-tRNA synthetase